jgi:ribosomal protein L11 methyltransferase
VIKNLHRWTRLSSAKWEDAWVERLRFLGADQLAFITWPDSRALKIEAYCDEKTAKQLVKRFGGRATKIAPHIWTGDPARPRAPLAIRGKLKVYSDEPTWKEWRESRKSPLGILVPAGMAFGTGEHATTATCLRLLADLAPELPEGFRALDLGTGSGILAIAAEVFGSSDVLAIDYDATAVRIARQNARKNGAKKVKAEEGDVLQLEAATPYDVVMANLFSEVLISATPRIAKSTKPGGWLIFSGVLKKQAPEVAAALQKAGFARPRIVPRGKWCAGICRFGAKK